MTSLWDDSTDDDSDSETLSVTDSTTDSALQRAHVVPEFTHCIHMLKWKLYQAIVLGPEPNTPEAQQNELLQTYVGQLEQLYRILEKALCGEIIDTTLHAFPAPLRQEILSCARDLQKRSKEQNEMRHAADGVPYRDFLKETLRMYPFVHRTSGGMVDVESL